MVAAWVNIKQSLKIKELVVVTSKLVLNIIKS